MLDGHSVLPLIEDEEATSLYGVMHWQWINSWAVRDANWKLIGKKGRGAKAKTNFSLHNLEDAEPEVVNYAAEKPEIVARLRGLHEAWVAEVMP